MKPAIINHGVQDYVYIECVKEGEGRSRFNVRVWKNTGSGRSNVIADGNMYRNMIAHADRRVDYVWTRSTGKMHRKSDFPTPFLT